MSYSTHAQPLRVVSAFVPRVRSTPEPQKPPLWPSAGLAALIVVGIILDNCGF